MSKHKIEFTPIHLIKTVTLPNTLSSVLVLRYNFILSFFFFFFFYKQRQGSRSAANPNSWHNYPFGPCMPLVPSSELCEPFRLDSINKCLTGLGGAPFPGSSGKIKDKWRIIDSQLSAKGISMTELLGSLPLSLSQSLSVLLFPHLFPCSVSCGTMSTTPEPHCPLRPNRKEKLIKDINKRH